MAAEKSHLYLWVPMPCFPTALPVMKAWGFEYKGNIIWEKVRKDGEPDGRVWVLLPECDGNSALWCQGGGTGRCPRPGPR